MNSDILKNSYEKRKFFSILFMALQNLYDDYVIPQLKRTETGYKFPLFYDEISILHNNLTKLKGKLLELVGNANGGKCEITDILPDDKTVHLESNGEYVQGESLDEDVIEKIINILNEPVGEFEKNDKGEPLFKYGSQIFTRTFVSKNTNKIPDSEKYVYSNDELEKITPMTIRTDNLIYEFEKGKGKADDITQNFLGFTMSTKITVILLLSSNGIKINRENYETGLLNEPDTILDKIYTNEMEKIIQNQWMEIKMNGGIKYYFNPILRVFGQSWGTEQEDKYFAQSVVNGISSNPEKKLNPYTKWIEFVDPVYNKKRYFCPQKKIYGQLKEKSLLKSRRIVFYNEITGLSSYFTGDNSPYNKPPVVDRFFDKFLVDLPNGILSIIPRLKNGIESALFGKANDWKFTKTESKNDFYSAFSVDDCKISPGSFAETKQFLELTPDQINEFNKTKNIESIFKKKAIMIITKKEEVDILTATGYFSRVILFLENYCELLDNRMKDLENKGKIRTPDQRRIMDLGFFLLRKTAMSEEIDEIFKLVSTIIGSPFKFLFGIIPAVKGYFFNKTKKITKGELVEGGGRNNSTRKINGGQQIKEFLGFVPSDHKPSYMTWNLFSGLLRYIDCDIREKYVFLSYVNNLIETFDDNMFSKVALEKGKEKSTMLSITDALKAPYRFYEKNKILGSLFIAYAAVGTLLTGASYVCPLITHATIAALHIGGKVLKVSVVPFVNESKQFATHKDDISKINKNIGKHVDKEVLKNALLYGTNLYDRFMSSNVSLYYKFEK
jgi:hypothetical protein